MKHWRYIGFDPEKRRMKEGFVYKNPLIISDTQPLNEDGDPDEDYENITTEELLIKHESNRYPERRRRGEDYAYEMDSRLIILGNNISNEELSESVRGHIDAMFKSTRDEIDKGRWISAKREINSVVVSDQLQMLIDAYSLPIVQETLINEIIDRIDLEITNLY